MVIYLLIEVAHLYIYKYEDVCMCLCVCVCLFVFSRFSRPFGIRLGCPLAQMCFDASKWFLNNNISKKIFSAELMPFFYISLRFLCKFEERL